MAVQYDTLKVRRETQTMTENKTKSQTKSHKGNGRIEPRATQGIRCGRFGLYPTDLPVIFPVRHNPVGQTA